MTTCQVVRKEKEATIEIKGHAEYSAYGTDIVCASVSTACIFTANLIERLKLSYNVMDLVCDEGYFRLQISREDSILNGLFDNLEEMMKEVAKQYPKNLKMK